MKILGPLVFSGPQQVGFYRGCHLEGQPKLVRADTLVLNVVLGKGYAFSSR